MLCRLNRFAIPAKPTESPPTSRHVFFESFRVFRRATSYKCLSICLLGSFWDPFVARVIVPLNYVRIREYRFQPHVSHRRGPFLYTVDLNMFLHPLPCEAGAPSYGRACVIVRIWLGMFPVELQPIETSMYYRRKPSPAFGYPSGL